MTSKALEVAADALYELGIVDPKPGQTSFFACKDVVGKIIRAYAENITEEMARAAERAREARLAAQYNPAAQVPYDDIEKSGIRAAILKGLE
jgi:hypothetical protein